MAQPTNATFDPNRKAYVETQTITRLSPEVYNDLERKHATFRPNSTSTELEAGYALGVQAVLKDLRAGFVVGR
jgi:hypothetical protein